MGTFDMCFKYSGSGGGPGRGLATFLVVAVVALPLTVSAEPTWSDVFDGKASGGDTVADSAVTDDGAVYLTGRSESEHHGSDLLVLKYASDGELQWTARVDSEEEGVDVGTSLAVDPEGGVVAVGGVGGPYEIADDRNLLTDMAVVRFAPDGTKVWQTRVESRSNNAIATSVRILRGAVYVVGTYTDVGIVPPTLAMTVGKFSLTDGRKEWLNWEQDAYVALDEVDGLEASDAVGLGLDSQLLAPAPDGDVYAVGWVGSWGGEAQADVLVTRKGEVGTWRKSYDHGGTYDGVSAVATDGSGNLLFTGESIESDGTSYAVTRKISPANELLWESEVPTGTVGSGDMADAPHHSAADITVDSAGDAYVTGFRRTRDSSFDDDTLTFKLDGASGEKLWEDVYDEARLDRARSLELADGRLHVAGESGRTDSRDYLIVEYSADDGHRRSVHRWDAGKAVGGVAETLSLFPNGDVVVSGVLGQREKPSTFDIGTVRWSNDGSPRPSGASSAGCGCRLGGGNGEPGGVPVGVLVMLGFVMTGVPTARR